MTTTERTYPLRRCVQCHREFYTPNDALEFRCVTCLKELDPTTIDGMAREGAEGAR